MADHKHTPALRQHIDTVVELAHIAHEERDRAHRNLNNRKGTNAALLAIEARLAQLVELAVIPYNGDIEHED